MIDWKIINYINKVKYKNILLITDNIDITKYIHTTSNINIISGNQIFNHKNTVFYDLIASWDFLLYGNSQIIYTKLALLNFMLKDYGEIYLKVYESKAHLEEDDKFPFCWNYDRIVSIGKTKNLKIKKQVEKIKHSTETFLRFKYIPDF